VIAIPGNVRVWLATGHTDMPNDFDEITAAAPKNIKVASVGIALQAFLNQPREAREAATPSTPASTTTRRSFPISITMRPFAGVAGVKATGSATTIAGTKPDFCPTALSGSVQNDRRQFSKSEREMPYRRAVDEIARGVCMLSRTILSFSSSVQRRRRPVSTTPSRST
jgi:hypothetical protein